MCHVVCVRVRIDVNSLSVIDLSDDHFVFVG